VHSFTIHLLFAETASLQSVHKHQKIAKSLAKNNTNCFTALCPGLPVWAGTRRNISPTHTYPDHVADQLGVKSTHLFWLVIGMSTRSRGFLRQQPASLRMSTVLSHVHTSNLGYRSFKSKETELVQFSVISRTAQQQVYSCQTQRQQVACIVAFSTSCRCGWTLRERTLIIRVQFRWDEIMGDVNAPLSSRNYRT